MIACLSIEIQPGGLQRFCGLLRPGRLTIHDAKWAAATSQAARAWKESDHAAISSSCASMALPSWSATRFLDRDTEQAASNYVKPQTLRHFRFPC
ncbi:MAG: hypothetical protein O2931_04440 [Planctomycetota bacterium]|nr:hypothetical protein [Planctomycetota bacterium]MDA1178029.1 hypothetical protein [Planctomycetota bacterium]